MENKTRKSSNTKSRSTNKQSKTKSCDRGNSKSKNTRNR